MANETRTSQQTCSFVRERPSHVRARHDFVADRLTHGVAARWIHDQPSAPGGGVRIATCFHLVPYERVLRPVRAVVRIGWPGQVGNGVDLIDGIARPVDIQIETEIEIMLVNRRVKLRSDQHAVSWLNAWRIGTDRQASGQLNLKLYFAALI